MIKKLWLCFWLVSMQQNSLAIDGYGQAYLMKITNKTNFPLELIFPDSAQVAKELTPDKIDQASLLLNKNIKALFLQDKGLHHRIIPAGGTLGQNPPDALASSANAVLATGRNVIKDPAYKDISDSKIARKPIVLGYGKNEVVGYTKTQALIVAGMLNRGAVWYSQVRPWPKTLSFTVYVPDNDQVSIWFGPEEFIDAPLKICLGMDKNTKSAIFVNDQEVATCRHADFPEAKIRAGGLKDFWLSADAAGTILVGCGNPGQNIFLAYQNKDLLAQAQKFGLSTNQHPVTWADIELTPAVQFVPPPHKPLFTLAQTNQNVDLPTPGQGLLLIKNAKSADLKIKFFNEENPNQVQLFFTQQGAEFFVTLKDETGQEKELVRSSSNLSDNFFLQLEQQKLLIGQETASNLAVVALAKHADLAKLDNFVVQSASSNLEIKLYQPIQPAVNFSDGQQSGTNYSIDGTWLVVQPFMYQFSQEGPAIMGRDLIFNSSYVLGSAAQQQALYSFELAINKDTTPDIKWQIDPINPVRFALKAGAVALNLLEGFMFQKADQVPEEHAGEITTELNLTAENLGWASAGMLSRMGAAMLNTEATLGFRNKKDFYTATDSVRKTTTTKKMNEEAQAKGLVIKQKLDFLESTSMIVRKDFDYALAELSAIFDMMNHRQTISGDKTKKQIMDGLKKLLAAYPTVRQELVQIDNQGKTIILATQSLLNPIFALLLKALKNPFFLDLKTTTDSNRRQILLREFNALAEEAFRTRDTVTLRASPQIPYWTPYKLTAGEGFLTFAVKGPADFYIILAADKENLAASSQIYQICLGQNDNKLASISTMLNAPPVKSVTFREKREIAINTFEAQTFWLKISQAQIELGAKDLSEKPFLTWDINYPIKDDLWVGFYPLYSDAEVSNVLTLDAKDPLLAQAKPSIANILQSKKPQRTSDLEAIAAAEKKLLTEREQQAALKKSLNQEDTLLQTTNAEKYADFDPLEYQAMLDKYDDLEFDMLDMEEWRRTKGEQILTTNQVIAKKAAAQATANTGPKDLRDASAEKRGALQKQMAQGLAGALAQAKMEYADLKGLSQQPFFYFKKVAAANQDKALAPVEKEYLALKEKESRAGVLSAEEQAQVAKFEISLGVMARRAELAQLTAKPNLSNTEAKRLDDLKDEDKFYTLKIKPEDQLAPKERDFLQDPENRFKVLQLQGRDVSDKIKKARGLGVGKEINMLRSEVGGLLAGSNTKAEDRYDSNFVIKRDADGKLIYIKQRTNADGTTTDARKNVFLKVADDVKDLAAKITSKAKADGADLAQEQAKAASQGQTDLLRQTTGTEQKGSDERQQRGQRAKAIAGAKAAQGSLGNAMANKQDTPAEIYQEKVEPKDGTTPTEPSSKNDEDNDEYLDAVLQARRALAENQTKTTDTQRAALAAKDKDAQSQKTPSRDQATEKSAEPENKDKQNTLKEKVKDTAKLVAIGAAVGTPLVYVQASAQQDADTAENQEAYQEPPPLDLDHATTEELVRRAAGN